MELSEKQIVWITGGGDPMTNPVITAIRIASGVYTTYAGAATILDATHIYSGVGHNVGETVFEIIHPNQLGKMIYFPQDFGF
jgi:hypothetical protein